MTDSSQIVWIFFIINGFSSNICWTHHILQTTSESDSPCGDWTTYTREKCIKILDVGLLTQAEAELQCHELVEQDHSRIVTIKTLEEQQFLSSFLIEQNKVVGGVWLGITPWNEETKEASWTDGTRPLFTNWGEERDKSNHELECVQMEMGLDSNYCTGTWTWVPCNKTNVVVCERVHGLSVKSLRRKFLKVEKLFKDAIGELKSEIQLLKKTQTVPIGFVYTQLSFQLPPTDIWPDLGWKDVSENYAGLFFRVTGGKSGGMNQIQEDSCPIIKSVKYEKGYDGNPIDIKANGQWSGRIYSGSDKGEHWGIRFLVSSEEVRPRNQAIRVWQRIQ